MVIIYLLLKVHLWLVLFCHYICVRMNYVWLDYDKILDTIRSGLLLCSCTKYGVCTVR